MPAAPTVWVGMTDHIAHDVLVDNGTDYLRRFANGSTNGWYSFDHSGVHFIALVNVLDLKAGGLGFLGDAQLTWLKRDLTGQSASTPIVVFAHRRHRAMDQRRRCPSRHRERDRLLRIVEAFGHARCIHA
jgi:hypothetical protein